MSILFSFSNRNEEMGSIIGEGIAEEFERCKWQSPVRKRVQGKSMVHRR